LLRFLLPIHKLVLLERPLAVVYTITLDFLFYCHYEYRLYDVRFRLLAIFCPGAFP